MEPTEKLILVDLDGTLASSAWRDHLVEGSRKMWPEYYKGIPFDAPVPAVKAQIESLLGPDVRVIYITAREESLQETRKTSNGTEEKISLPIRKWTMDWLSKHSAPGWGTGAQLFMRKAKDHRPSSTVKEEVLNKHLGGNKTKNVILALDDNENVIQMYRKNGIENAVLVQDPAIEPNLAKQDREFMSTVPVAKTLLHAAYLLTTQAVV